MIVVLCGAPGAGKGTQAQRLHDERGFAKISTGDAFRANIAAMTAVGKEAKDYMDKGLLVPDALTCRVLESEISGITSEKILLDGFPRNISQAEAFEVTRYGKSLAKVIYLEVSEAELVSRLSKRRVCSSCKRVYQATEFDFEKCQHCGSSLETRADDAPEKIKERFRVYEKETKPMLDFYRKKGLLHTVDGENAEDVVFKKIQLAIN